MKVTATAYLGSSSLMSPEELHNATPEELVKHLTFRDESAFWVEIGYTKVGTAKIEIELAPQSTISGLNSFISWTNTFEYGSS